MKKVFFKTFGCRTNIYDTQVMINQIKDFTITQNEDEADIIVVNSCTVTNGADSGVRNFINHASKRGVKVIMSGCGAFEKGKDLQKDGKVFGVLGHSKKHEINTLLKEDKPFTYLGDLKSIDKEVVTQFHGKSKAFLKIQEGCNFRCSYCIIPYVRGNSRSQEEEQILNQIKILSQKGYEEFVLTGTNIGSYGKDKNTSLGELLQKIGKLSAIKRVRLGSIEPVQIDESFKEILDEPWLEKHLHIALQHTNEEVLGIMRRRNHLDKDLELFTYLKDKGFALGTDYIVAHPGETQKRWEDAVKNFKLFPLTHLHSFIYSKRDGTPSANMQQEVPPHIAKERQKEIESIVKENNINFRKENRVPLDIHVESFKRGFFQGYDQFYNQMLIKSDTNLLKTWVKIDSYNIGDSHNESKL